MAKYRTLAPGDGTTGPTGAEYRALINDSIPGDVYYVPETFVWTEDLSSLANRTLKVTYTHAITGNITLPAGCVLLFDGGAFTGSGTIIGNSTKILNPSNKQIFDVTNVIAGTWLEVKGCVQWFGAISQPNITTYSNDMMPALGKLLSARWGVFWLHGNYYVGSSLAIVNPVVMVLDGATRPDELSIQGPTGKWTPMTPATPSEVTRLYSNLDIDWFKIESPYVKILGGTFDNSGVPSWNHSMIYISGNHSIDHCEFKQTVVGSRDGVRAPNQSGHYAFWEAEGAIYAGHLYSVFFDADINSQPWGIEIQSSDLATHSGVWANGIHIKGRMTGCKKAIDHQSANWANIDITIQSDDCLDETEKDWYQVRLNGYPIELNCFCWDLYGTLSDDGGWYPKNPVYLEQYGANLVGQSIVAYRLGQFRGEKPLSVPLITNGTTINLFKDNRNGNVFISDIHNYFVGWDRKGTNTIEITGRTGSGFDFDTELEPGTTAENANIAITGASHIVDPVGDTDNFPARYQFNTGADADIDFVEIVMTPGTSDYNIRIQAMFLFLLGAEEIVKRIQFIGTQEDDSYTVLNVYPKKQAFLNRAYHEFTLNNTVYKKIVFRLIGVGKMEDLVHILDLAGKSSATQYNFVPRINDYQFKWAGLLTQSGTDDPVIEELLKVTSRVVTATRTSIGVYRLQCDYNMAEGKADPYDVTNHIYEGTTFKGTVRMKWHNSSRYVITTWDENGELSDGILNKQHISFNTAW